MPTVRFYDLLGVTDDASAAAIWPRSRIKSAIGFSIDADPTDLVRYLQSALEFHAVRPGAAPDRVGFSAEVVVNNPPAPIIRPLVLTQMPDVAFYLQNTAGHPGTAGYRPARAYITEADTGVELVIEGLPVEIHVPSSLLGPLRTEAEEEANPGGGPDVTLTDPFQPGVYDSLQVTLRDTGESSIFVHLRVRMTEEMDFVIEPATVVSIGPCRFNGLPCRGLHDLDFFPSSRLQGNHSKGELPLEWTRHPLDRLSPDAKYAGVLTVRTVDLDGTRAPLKELSEKMNAGRASDEQVEFVLQDIALPFWSVVNLPIPSHGLFGLRRPIKAGDNPGEAYAFTNTPVQIALGDWRLLIDQLLLRTPASLDPLDQFIFVQMALLFGSDTDTTYAATFGVSDEWTLQSGWHSPAGLTLFTVADAALSLWGAKVGWSLKRFASKHPHYEWYSQLQLLVDLGLSTKPTTLFDGAFKMRSLSGHHLEVVWRDVGWNLGELDLAGLSFPEGVQFIFYDAVRLIVEELGWITENNGGRYFSFSGGVSVFPVGGKADRSPQAGAGSAAIKDKKDKGGGIRFHRLRFRTSGNPSAPAWLLDGVTLALSLNRFTITGFGMVSEFTDSGNTYKEFGFGIKVGFGAIDKQFLIGMQLFYGHVSGPTEDFTYWMFGFQMSPIPIGSFRLVNIRMLLAGNMTPKLPAPEGYAQNMRLFRWYKDNGNAAITMPPNRKLGAWSRRNDSFAAGLGAGLTLPVGKTITLDLFLFFEKSPDEMGLLIALEVFVLKSPKAVGFGALEFDFERDKWGFMIGVAIGLDNVLGSSCPSFLSRLVSLTGTLYAGNKPGTFAIGQLNDQTTWLSFGIKPPAFIDVSVLTALCVQLVDMPDGPRGFGMVVSAKGGTIVGVGKLQVYASFGLLAGVWRNESKSSGFVIWIEAALRIKVFFVFNFGISAKIEFDYLGGSPVYRRLGCEIRIETPWWLPDVTFRFEKIWGEPKPELMEAISTPLVAAGATDPGNQTQKDIAVTPLFGSSINEREVYSMDQLRALGAPALSSGALDALSPVGVDSVIALNFKPAVDDRLSVGENTPAGAGTQKSNDLTATYELVEMAIRRRPRFGAGAGVWTALLAPEDTRLESPADFPTGSDLEAHFTSAVSFKWDKDLLCEGRLDPRRLLINASTPYTFLTRDPEADESLARSEPGWPCCGGNKKQKDLSCRELDFYEMPFGSRAPSYQNFPDSRSTLHWSGPGTPIIVPGRAAPPGSHAARVDYAGRGEGILATLSLDEPAYTVQINAYWFPAAVSSELIVEAYNGLKQVSRQTFPLRTASPPAAIRFESLDGITSVMLHYVPDLQNLAPDQQVSTGWIEFTLMSYCSLAGELRRLAQTEKCSAGNKRTVPGGGKLAWLPNHEYEISLTTKITLNHAQTGSQEARVKQQSFFRTKGLTGLNAVNRTGDELEPYVESRYPGSVPRTLYRSEPAALAFNENFNILLPVDRTPSPDKPEELNQLLEWVLAVEKVGGATGGERVSQTSPDWVAAHRTTPLPPLPRRPIVIDGSVVHPTVRKAVTLDPFRMRFEAMLHSQFGCNRPGPSLQSSQVLFHEPIDPGAAPGDPQHWEANSLFLANVRPKDAPFVERNPFDDNDYTAFITADEGRTAGSPWRSTGGVMRVSGSTTDSVRRYAVFGGSDWNHIQIHTTVDPEGGAAGVAVGVGGLPAVTRAVMALVDESARTLRLVERRQGVVSDLAAKPLPAGGGAPYTLEVVAFDDQLRARVGGTEVEAPRDDVREGRLALVAQNGGAFTSLIVESTDAYRFEFQSSRFISFEEHIGSFSGDATQIPVDTAGPATETAASLLAATASEITTVMTPDADPETRQRLFDRWVRGLVLPLRHRVIGLELSRLVRGDKTELFLLESPEPLPFSEDVSATLQRRTTFLPFPVRPKSTLLGLVSLLGKRFGKGVVKPLTPAIPKELVDLVNGLDFSGGTVSGPVHSETVVRKMAEARSLVRTVEIDNELEYRVYAVRLSAGRGRSVQLSGKIVNVIRPRGRFPYAAPLLRTLAGMRANEIAFVDALEKLVFPYFIPVEPVTRVAVSVRVLTDGSETRALIIPVDAGTGALLPLTGGAYRIDFEIDRARFRSQIPDATSNYRAQASINLWW